METYTFSAYGATHTQESATLGKAMEAANKVLLWSNPKSKDGAWFQAGTSSNWSWTEGNYFD